MNEMEALASHSNCDDRLSDSNCFFIVTAFPSERFPVATVFSQQLISRNFVHRYR